MDKVSLQKEFIEFLIREGALAFGDYTLKSGRLSPYFINMRILSSGRQCYQLGSFYAETIYRRWGDDFEVVFGPAYAGIPLAVSTVIALKQKFNSDKCYLTNRKEKKTYADASSLVGAKLYEGARIVLVDDVITTGATKIEAVELLKSENNVSIVGLVIGFDRLERGEGKASAVAEFARGTGIPIKSIVTIADVLAHLQSLKVQKMFNISSELQDRLKQYLEHYGV